MRRWARDARLDWVTGALVLAFAVLRLAATLGRPVSVFNDTESYFWFRIWGGVRFPVVTALYSVVGDHRAIAVIQASLGVLAWVAAAIVAGSVLVHRAARYGFQGALFALGLTLPVTRFDNGLLSESIAISLTVVLVACALRFACRPTRVTAIVVFVVASTWALTRQNNALLLGVAAVVVAGFGAGRADRRVAWTLAAGMAAVSVLGLAMAMSTSNIQDYNTAQIIVRRVLPNDDRYQWFRDHNMPNNGRVLVVPPYENTFNDPAVELQWDPRFGRWLREDGETTYLRYLVTHPGFTLTTPFSDDGALRALAVGTEAYGSSRRVVPDLVDTVFWPQTGGEQTALAVFVAGILVAGAVCATRSRSYRRAFAGAGGVLVVAVVNVMMVTHTAGYEYERLLVPTGVAARIALLWLLAALAGGVSVAPASVPPGRGSRRRDAGSSGPVADPAPSTSPDPAAADSSAALGAGRGSGPPGTW